MTVVDWSHLALDKSNPTPLYHQLAEAIRDRIRDGKLSAGAQLPPERDLADLAGISRMTARQALADLARAGLIDVRHGVGAFVAAPKLTYDALHLLGFTEETLRLGGDATTTVLTQALCRPPVAIANRLELRPEALAVEIVRLRSTRGEPLLLETSWAPAALCPGLEAADLARQSLYDLLENHFGLHLAEARQTVEVATADDDDARLLGVSPGAPVLLVNGVARAVTGRPIEAFTALYRADRVRFRLASRREPAGIHTTEREISLVMR